MINAGKKQWSTPKLRIFVKTMAGEAVLYTCKYKHIPTGPNQINNNCSVTPPACPNCSDVLPS
jgi:hypothetical protein